MLLLWWILPLYLLEGGETFSAPPSSQLAALILESQESDASRSKNASSKGESADCADSMEQKVQVPSFYHKSEDVRSLISELASTDGRKRCKDLSLIRTKVKPEVGHSLTGDEAAQYEPALHENILDAVRISRGSEPKANRLAIMFSEHGRELISTELGVNLLKVLCGVKAGADANLRRRARGTLKDTEFLLMPLVDENGRQRAEAGATCSSRDNEHNVDLNRNWDYAWAPGGSCRDGKHGPFAFSEPETQVASKLLEDFKPTSFLSIHSGATGLYNPGAATIDPSEAKAEMADSWTALLNISHNIKQFVGCQCNIGAAGRVTHLTYSGTSIDYVGLKMKVPYAQAWEVWQGRDNDCMPYFSPARKPEYKRALHKWTTSMLYFAEATAGVLKGTEGLHPVMPGSMSEVAHSVDTSRESDELM